MLYVDTSVILAHILAEDRSPPISMWANTLISSRLLEYEVWTRIHARKLTRTHGELVQQTLDRMAFIELASHVLARALEPFPVQVRTLDAIHLSSIEFLRSKGQELELASYDERLNVAARSLGILLAF